jgi:hypothetical protein
MKKVVLLALAAVLAWPLAAQAQEAPAPLPAPAPAAAPAAAPVATTSTDAEPGPHKGYKGINVGIFPSGGLPTVGGAYFLKDDAALRLDLGFDLNKPGPGQNVLVGFSVEGGYRLYLGKYGRFSPFVQPGLFFAKAAERGNFGRLMVIQANVGLGGEFFVTNNFSASAQAGLGVRFAREFDEIRVATGTTGIFVNWYW